MWFRVEQNRMKPEAWRLQETDWRSSTGWGDDIRIIPRCSTPRLNVSVLFLKVRLTTQTEVRDSVSGGSTRQFVSISLDLGEKTRFPLIWVPRLKTPEILGITHNPLFHRAFALCFDPPRSSGRVLFWDEKSAVWKTSCRVIDSTKRRRASEEPRWTQTDRTAAESLRSVSPQRGSADVDPDVRK